MIPGTRLHLLNVFLLVTDPAPITPTLRLSYLPNGAVNIAHLLYSCSSGCISRQAGLLRSTVVLMAYSPDFRSPA